MGSVYHVRGIWTNGWRGTRRARRRMRFSDTARFKLQPDVSRIHIKLTPSGGNRCWAVTASKWDDESANVAFGVRLSRRKQWRKERFTSREVKHYRCRFCSFWNNIHRVSLVVVILVTSEQRGGLESLSSCCVKEHVAFLLIHSLYWLIYACSILYDFLLSSKHISQGEKPKWRIHKRCIRRRHYQSIFLFSSYIKTRT